MTRKKNKISQWRNDMRNCIPFTFISFSPWKVKIGNVSWNNVTRTDEQCLEENANSLRVCIERKHFGIFSYHYKNWSFFFFIFSFLNVNHNFFYTCSADKKQAPNHFIQSHFCCFLIEWNRLADIKIFNFKFLLPCFAQIQTF